MDTTTQDTTQDAVKHQMVYLFTMDEVDDGAGGSVTTPRFLDWIIVETPPGRHYGAASQGVRAWKNAHEQGLNPGDTIAAVRASDLTEFIVRVDLEQIT